MLEGARDLHVGQETEEQRLGIPWQLLFAELLQRVKFLPRLQLHRPANGDHAAAPILDTGHLHTINISLLNTSKAGHDLGDFHGGAILTLPAEGVTDAVSKEEKTQRVLGQQVSGTKPVVALGKCIQEDLLASGLFVGVALEVLHGVAGYNGEDQLPCLTGAALDAKAILPADHLLQVHIKLHYLGVHDLVDYRASSTHSPSTCPIIPVAEVDERTVALRGPIEFHHKRNSEAVLELVPDLRT
mmetsp:Transcript_62435/g.145323  ORF Transcript_62435/g.145323 Transcript_62435/m.145323 type:complete len:243 (-) Transcript_62435:1078-1806(-)